MLKTIIADNDRAALEQLEGLIDWKAEGIDLIGSASTGNELIEMTRVMRPDLVILDTDITGTAEWVRQINSSGVYNGLDIVAHFQPFKQYVRFILTSEHRDFDMLKKAIHHEAMDYLVKPVSAEDLKAAIRYVQEHRRSRSEIEAAIPVISDFRSEQYQNGAISIPDADDHYCKRILENREIDFSTHFAVGICTGIVPELSEELSKVNYQHLTTMTLTIYSRILSFFREKDMGFEVRRTAHRIRVMGVFPLEDEPVYIDKYIRPLNRDLEQTYEIRLCTGIGSHAYSADQLYTSYKDSQYSYEMYFFEQKPIITWYETPGKYTGISSDEYEKRQDEVVHAILTKDPRVMDIVESSIDSMAETHYGNWQALIMRAMNYTGDISARLRRYRLIEDDFFEAQDELQNQLLQSVLYSDVKRELMDYFRKLLPKVYKNTRHSSKVSVELVKTYMQENFMREISIKELSEVACVSTNYFSHMFKNETGQNYKSYLTNIRLEHAVELLLNSDYGLYEISDRAGYQNVRTFVDAFKQKYGLSPTKYKKKMLQEKEQ